MATENEIIQAIAEIESVDTLRDIFSSIAIALRNKGVNQNPIYPNEFARFINNLEIGTGSDASNATATTNDIASGKTAYGPSGLMVGTVYEARQNVTYLNDNTCVLEVQDTSLKTDTNIIKDVLMRPNSIFRHYIPLSNFGNATVEDVLVGKTFTSTSGLKMKGTYTPSQSGVDTSDATAIASDIVNGKIAYGKNGRVVGTYVNKKLYTISVGDRVKSITINGSSMNPAIKLSDYSYVMGMWNSTKTSFPTDQNLKGICTTFWGLINTMSFEEMFYVTSDGGWLKAKVTKTFDANANTITFTITDDGVYFLSGNFNVILS